MYVFGRTELLIITTMKIQTLLTNIIQILINITRITTIKPNTTTL